MLLEVDRVSEPVDDLVAKLRRYHEWFELLAPKADANKEEAARSHGGLAVHAFRLWSRLYPATGREGYVPVAFVFTGKSAAQRESRIRRQEQPVRAYFAGTTYLGREAGITAVDYHQAVPVVVTELERITADPARAAGAVWRRLGRDEWQTLHEALDNPDGDRLYAVQHEQARRRRAEREAAERRPSRRVATRAGRVVAVQPPMGAARVGARGPAAAGAPGVRDPALVLRQGLVDRPGVVARPVEVTSMSASAARGPRGSRDDYLLLLEPPRRMGCRRRDRRGSAGAVAEGR
ncbi:hypothetical protein AB5J72_49930 [Streptomyces sp. CG1]|uniref:hypothetical protein n=1 Tax=Streptomyces sp. CG1 TaxID=1287523 RepID=UPI0034E214DB